MIHSSIVPDSSATPYGNPVSPYATLAGSALSAAVTLALLVDAAVQLFRPKLQYAEMAAVGFPTALSAILGCITLACAVVYALPRTAFLGAILISGFLGGAIALHFRVGEVGSPPQFICLLLGAMTWGGLYLRHPHWRRWQRREAEAGSAPSTWSSKRKL